MNKITWLDQTLSIAVSRQFAAEKLADFAGVLAALGLQQAVIRLADWQGHQQGLVKVLNQFRLYGLLDLTGCELLLAKQAGITHVVLACNVANREEFGAGLKAVMLEAGLRGLAVSLLLAGLDSLADDELADLIIIIKQYPIAAVIYQDKDGKANPFTLFDQITLLKNGLGCPIGVSASNAYGLATANTLAALKAGATQVASAVGGLGGCAPWEETLMVVRQFLGINTILPPQLAIGCQQVLSILGLAVPADKAIFGPAIFAHESGLHVDGVTKAPEIYEPFAPELVGLSRQLIIGKHSGTAALKTKFAAWGICLEEEESKQLLSCVRALAVRKKTAICDDELRRLYLSGWKV